MPPKAEGPVRLALIGAGRWGRNYIRTIDELPDVEIAILCSSNPASAGLVSRTPKVTSDWRSALEWEGIAGVIIATPPPLHAEMVLAALDAGRPVMVEKPLTLDVGEAEEIQRRAAGTGVPVLVDHTYLFHPAYQTMKSMVQAGGSVLRIESHGGNLGPFRADTPPLWDYGAHDVAMCIDLLGDRPTSVTARETGATSAEGGEGHIYQVDLRFEAGQTAELTIGNGMREKRRYFSVFCDQQILVFDDLAEDRLVRHPSVGGSVDGPGEPMAIEPTRPLSAAVQAFAAGIRGRTNELFGVDLAVEVVQVLRDCDRALLDQ